MSSEQPRASVYTPFLRRFTDERARDLADTIALYSEVRRAHLASVWARENALARVGAYITEWVAEIVEPPRSPALADALDRCLHEVLGLETTIFTSPEIDWDRANLSLKEQTDLRRFLRAQQHFLANDDHVSDLLTTALANVVAGVTGGLPSLPEARDGPAFTRPRAEQAHRQRHRHHLQGGAGRGGALHHPAASAL